MPGGLGLPELAIILVIVLIVFGPKRLPGLGRQLGSGMREFKESITGASKRDDDDGPGDLVAAASQEPAAREPSDPTLRTPRG